MSVHLSLWVWNEDEWDTGVVSAQCHRFGPPISVHNPNSQEQAQDKMTGTGEGAMGEGYVPDGPGCWLVSCFSLLGSPSGTGAARGGCRERADLHRPAVNHSYVAWGQGVGRGQGTAPDAHAG